jgi:hypothetical protein
LEPALDAAELAGLAHSAEVLRAAHASVAVV